MQFGQTRLNKNILEAQTLHYSHHFNRPIMAPCLSSGSIHNDENMIERNISVILLLFYFVLSNLDIAKAQDHNFAYVQKENGRKSSALVASGKFATAKKVYDALATARGDLRMSVPEFTMNSGEQYVAWMDPINKTIGIEEKAYDACMQLGADSLNALAALLSHELTHYYEKHNWSRNFAKDNQGLDSSDKIGALDEGVKQETQADYLGGFLALTAGYNIYGITAQLLPELYKTYALPDNLKNYPSLSDRVQMSENAAEQLKALQVVYETAQYLSLLEDFETAASYYGYILTNYAGREIINNAGVNQALAALKLFSAKEMPYVLPLEPDPNSRLYALKGQEQDRIRKRTLLLNEALQDFDRAAQLDPNYAPALLNKACCYTLLNAWDDAEYWLRKYKKLPNANANSAMVMAGIIAALQQDNDKAKDMLEKANTEGSPLANINLRVFSQVSLVPPGKVGAAEIETINDIYLDDFLEAPEVDKEIKPTAKSTCAIKQYSNSKILVHMADNGTNYTVIQLCSPGCESATRKGIKLGSTAAEVEETYGPPIHQVAWRGGYAWTYPHLNLLFEFNNSGSLQTWGSFRQSVE